MKYWKWGYSAQRRFLLKHKPVATRFDRIRSSSGKLHCQCKKQTNTLCHTSMGSQVFHIKYKQTVELNVLITYMNFKYNICWGVINIGKILQQCWLKNNSSFLCPISTETYRPTSLYLYVPLICNRSEYHLYVVYFLLHLGVLCCHLLFKWWHFFS